MRNILIVCIILFGFIACEKSSGEGGTGRTASKRTTEYAETFLIRSRRLLSKSLSVLEPAASCVGTDFPNLAYGKFDVRRGDGGELNDTMNTGLE